MAELNFGLLTPPGSQSIGNAFVSGMDQAAVARAQENQNALSQYTLGKARREEQVQNAINSAYQGAIGPDGKVDYGKVNAALAAGGAGSKIPEAEAARRKAELDAVDLGIKRGTLNLQPTTLAAAQGKLVEDKFKLSRELLEGVSTPEQYIAWHESNHADPVLGKVLSDRGVTVEQSRARINAALQQPGGLERLINESKLGVAKFAEMNKPQNLSQTVDGKTRVISIPGMGGPAGIVSGSEGAVPQSPLAKLQVDIAAAKARNAPPAEIAALEQEAGRLNRLADIAGGQLGVSQAGLAIRNRELDPYGMFPPITAGGAPTVNALPGQPRPTVNALSTQVSGAAPAAPVAAPAGIAPKMTVADAFQNNVTGPEFVAVLPPNVKPLVESILRYDQRPPNPATKRGQQLLELVNQADKTYDAGKAQSRYVAKQTFVKGPVADSITASNTAIDHMDTLAKYGADLNNTDVRLVNAAKQGIAAAFGANAPTTFDATRRIVGQEVVKAVVANGGSMREREEAADAFNRANSPAQLAGVIQSYQALLGGRLKSTALRYENDTGLKDFNTKLLPATIRAISGETVAPAATASAGAPVKITGDADYDKLPSGTVFIDPKGQQRRKP